MKTKIFISIFLLSFVCLFRAQESNADLQDRQADFPLGGFNGFRQLVFDSLNVDAIKEEGILNTKVSFVVDKEGKLKDIFATGEHDSFNREAERALGTIKHKWIFAVYGGQAKDSKFNLPITLNLLPENNVIKEPPIYPDGGADGFRRAFAQIFDTGKIKGVGTFITVIHFYVETTGTITVDEIEGDNETIKKQAKIAISKVNKKWIPAKLNGNVVRSEKQTFPIKFDLDSF